MLKKVSPSWSVRRSHFRHTPYSPPSLLFCSKRKAHFSNDILLITILPFPLHYTLHYITTHYSTRLSPSSLSSVIISTLIYETQSLIKFLLNVKRKKEKGKENKKKNFEFESWKKSSSSYSCYCLLLPRLFFSPRFLPFRIVSFLHVNNFGKEEK